MKRTLTFALIAVFTLAIVELAINTACRNSTPEPSGQGQARAAAKATQAPLQLSLATDPQQPLYDKPVILRIHLTDQAGKPVEGATLRGSLTMPVMDMGKNEFEFAPKGNGDYEATANANMAGPWDLKVTATSGSDTAEKVFQIIIKE